MQDRLPIRTLHILPELKEGGLERGVIEKVIWLHEHGVSSLVVSAGGLWQNRLIKAGIRHIVLPVHSKNPCLGSSMTMWTSWTIQLPDLASGAA